MFGQLEIYEVTMTHACLPVCVTRLIMDVTAFYILFQITIVYAVRVVSNTQYAVK
jgi:hypothetical protein